MVEELCVYIDLQCFVRSINKDLKKKTKIKKNIISKDFEKPTVEQSVRAMEHGNCRAKINAKSITVVNIDSIECDLPQIWMK